jgi:hypothetical protein
VARGVYGFLKGLLSPELHMEPSVYRLLLLYVMPYVILLLLLHDAIWMEGKYTIAYGAPSSACREALNTMVAVSAEP